jgi:enoyl-[acyl-carrier-protein] reductase (NADH)
VHSIAFSPRDTLQGRVVDVPRDGFLTTMDVSCWTFIRMAHLAEPLMDRGGSLFTMTYYGSRMVVENYNVMGVAKAALESAVRYNCVWKVRAEAVPGGSPQAAGCGTSGRRSAACSPGQLGRRSLFGA